MELKKGTIIKNRYEILGKLGEGGFAITYKAIDNLVNRFVAIKVSESSLSHEAKILKTLNKVPHICHMYDYFVLDKHHYLVMRLVTGKSLAQFQKDNGGTINANIIKRLLPSVLITLDQMHKYDVIHRDISPGNFIVSDDYTLYLIDFGAATSLKQSSLKNHLIFNHKGLDAPESNDSSMQGIWTDIYSLCATIVYLLTGEGVPASEDRIKFDPVPSFLLRSSLSNKMQNALIKGLSVNPEKRYQSIMDFKKDFFGKEAMAEISSGSYSVHYHARTDIGKRPVNQDNFMVDTLFSYAGEDCEIKGYIDCNVDEFHVVALADGVASANHGELASKAAIQAVSHFIDSFKYSQELPQNLLEEFLNQLNEKIIFLGEKIGKTASTISIFFWKNNDYVIANIGDSPIFRLSGGKLSCLTTSHTIANAKIKNGEVVTPKDFHTITSYLGKENKAGSQMASYYYGSIIKGDIFLICSDGVSGMMTDEEKKKFIKKDGDKAIDAIFKCANKHPNMDNCTAVILKF